MGRPPARLNKLQAQALDRVRAISDALDRAAGNRDRAIVAASDLGVPRRLVAEAAGITAARVQQIVGPGRGREAQAGRTLHAAMESVLREHGGDWMHAGELAAAIAERGLYTMADGGPAPASQLRSRAGQYADIFEGSTDRSGRIRLRR